MLSRLPWDTIEEVALVLDRGAEKYGQDNWKLCEHKDLDRYKSAALRHLSKYMQGELVDQETGFKHLAHAVTNLLFLIHKENEYNSKQGQGDNGN